METVKSKSEHHFIKSSKLAAPSSPAFGTSLPEFSCSGDPCITFLVGQESAQEKFQTHKTLVCYYSSILNIIFATSEALDLVHRVKDTTNEAFALFIHWIYYKELPVIINSTMTNDTLILPVTEVYNLATKLKIPGLQKLAISNLEEASPRSPIIAAI
ncbi:hypothetical protein BJ878DRAFT_574683 [Calycina marina]|uniref:BTB domain-containing protein n=1 Tax=Calycina marina TaxID=1763456 RepID=A0A9P7Z4Z1_9HELO|nr:hypothetical protein BJ878DRAFT_574683 [Calycina marina]